VKPLSLVILLSVFTLVRPLSLYAQATVSEVAPADLSMLRAQFVAQRGGTKPSPSELRVARETLQADGTYPDINYTLRAKVGHPAFGHLERTLRLVTAAETSPEPERIVLREAAVRALRAWVRLKPETDHQWFNIIGVPIKLGQIALPLSDLLTPEDKSELRALLTVSLRDGVFHFGKRGSVNPATGQNLIWQARIALEAAALTDDDALAKFATDTISAGIFVAQKTGIESIQVDNAFHQHGAQLYNGGYGRAFTNDLTELGAALVGTPYALSPEKASILADYILDGSQWMIRGRWWDFGVMGRELSRLGQTSAGMTKALERVASLAPQRAEEARAFASRLSGETAEPTSGPLGHHQFWRADYAAHRRPNYSFSVHMLSSRTLGTESGNGENLRGWHLAEGVTALRLTGDEYFDIFPLWNWRLLPGLTAHQHEGPYKEMTWGAGARGTTAFAGGVMANGYGATGFDHQREGLHARKAWFMFDHELVALGADITSQTSDFPVATALDQSWARGEVSLGSGALRAEGAALTTGSTELPDARWLDHGSVRYWFPSPTPLTVSRETRKGEWNVINKSVPVGGRGSAQGEVFTAAINHGQNPQAATYAYVVLPSAGGTPEVTAPPLRILSNSPEIQAVLHDALALLQAVFYAPGSVTLPNGDSWAVDRPCIIQVALGQAVPSIAAASPSQETGDLTITRTPAGGAPHTLTLALPIGVYAGSTVIGELAPITAVPTVTP
jgi:chondroitin AC lyase